MENDAPQQAQMVIIVNSHLEVQTNFRGNPGLMLGMLGGIEYARSWCLSQLNAKEVPLCEEDESKHNLSIVVTKADAIRAYSEAYERMQKRLAAIMTSSEQATFEIPSSLSEI